MSETTITAPLTTIFTQPTDCSSSWTYEPYSVNHAPGGMLLQNAIVQSMDTTCFPSGFLGFGKNHPTQVFSPGACPSGWQTPAVFVNGAVTTAVCCPQYVYNSNNTQYLYFCPCRIRFSCKGRRRREKEKKSNVTMNMIRVEAQRLTKFPLADLSRTQPPSPLPRLKPSLAFVASSRSPAAQAHFLTVSPQMSARKSTAIIWSRHP
jgi:hypothetical protein